MSDSPSPSEQSPEQGLVAVGRILGAHGRDGEIRVRSTSNVPDRFDEGQSLALSKDGATPEGRRFQIVRSRKTITKGSEELILLFRGFHDRAQAIRLTDQWLCVAQAEVPESGEDEYFHYQLIGLKVRTVGGDELGEVTEILETGSNDVYVVAGPEGEVLVPALGNVVKEIDVASGLMTVDLPEGLR
jgi:16S rRNA processing protein RimM